MGHWLKLKCAHSPLNLRTLSSTSVSFTITSVQVPNLALTHMKRITVCLEKEALLTFTVEYTVSHAVSTTGNEREIRWVKNQNVDNC